MTTNVQYLKYFIPFGLPKHGIIFHVVGPSGMRALPLAAGRNEGVHYF
jgi:hypothetical protein